MGARLALLGLGKVRERQLGFGLIAAIYNILPARNYWSGLLNVESLARL